MFNGSSRTDVRSSVIFYFVLHLFEAGVTPSLSKAFFFFSLD